MLMNWRNICWTYTLCLRLRTRQSRKKTAAECEERKNGRGKKNIENDGIRIRLEWTKQCTTVRCERRHNRINNRPKNRANERERECVEYNQRSKLQTIAMIIVIIRCVCVTKPSISRRTPHREKSTGREWWSEQESVSQERGRERVRLKRRRRVRRSMQM